MDAVPPRHDNTGRISVLPLLLGIIGWADILLFCLEVVGVAPTFRARVFLLPIIYNRIYITGPIFFFRAQCEDFAHTIHEIEAECLPFVFSGSCLTPSMDML